MAEKDIEENRDNFENHGNRDNFELETINDKGDTDVEMTEKDDIEESSENRENVDVEMSEMTTF